MEDVHHVILYIYIYIASSLVTFRMLLLLHGRKNQRKPFPLESLLKRAATANHHKLRRQVIYNFVLNLEIVEAHA
jgi:hypothetical protein